MPHKNRWPRKTMKNNAIGSLLGSLLFFVFSLLHYSQLQRKGYVTFHYSPNFFGNEAEIMILMPFIIGLILLAISVYLFTKLYLKIRTGKIIKDNDLPPRFAMCTECGEPYNGFETQDMVCSECGGKLTDIKEYYSENRLKAEIRKKEYIGKIQHQ